MRERVAIMLLIVGILLLFSAVETSSLLDTLIMAAVGFACCLYAWAVFIARL